MATTAESKVKDAVKKLLKLFKAWYFIPVSNGMGKHGIPDIIACVPVKITQEMVGKTVGLFVGVECKRDNITEPSPRQKIQLREIKQAHGIAMLVNKERLDSFRKFLLRLCKNND